MANYELWRNGELVETARDQQDAIARAAEVGALCYRRIHPGWREPAQRSFECLELADGSLDVATPIGRFSVAARRARRGEARAATVVGPGVSASATAREDQDSPPVRVEGRLNEPGPFTGWTFQPSVVRYADGTESGFLGYPCLDVRWSSGPWVPGALSAVTRVLDVVEGGGAVASLVLEERGRVGEATNERPWVARVTGSDPNYGLAREFLSARRDYRNASRSGRSGVEHCYFLPPGIYEVYSVESATRRDRYFAVSCGGELTRLDVRDEPGLSTWPRLLGVFEVVVSEFVCRDLGPGDWIALARRAIVDDDARDVLREELLKNGRAR